MLGIANVHAAVKINYVISDHLGTPQMLIDQNRNVVWQADYDEFGKATLLVEQVEFNHRFSGQYYDKETELNYNYYRDYDPSLGRYVQSDPIGLKGGINTYGYVGGNPVMGIDPLGLKARVRCKIVPLAGWVSGAMHCYIEVDPDEGGPNETYGLMGDTGGPFSTYGEKGKNNSFDSGGIIGPWKEDDKKSSCDNDSVDSVAQCVRKVAAEYVDPSEYRFVRGPNSNTFAGTIARACGLVKASGWAPGWNDEPAGPADK